MNLDITWGQPTPNPSCGYKVEYRKHTDTSYTEISTSGGTSAHASIPAPASYEGVIISDCCSGSTSDGVLFGINGYSTFTMALSMNVSRQPVITVTSLYGNPYQLLLTGTYSTVSTSGTTNVPFNFSYAANSTNQQEVFLPALAVGVSVGSITLADYSAVFVNGGELQQYVAGNTANYFQFYNSINPSGTTWNGAPISLPSFTLMQFDITEVDGAGNTLAGNLHTSYVLGTRFNSGFTTLIFEVYDGVDLIGSLTSNVTPFGLRNEVIELVKGDNPLDTDTEFTMKVLWPDNNIVDTKVFYLPV